jgi:WhiB family redox-sensing transcriptional regulator
MTMTSFDHLQVAAVVATHVPANGWSVDARCGSVPLAEFFEDEPTAAARCACEQCPVRLDCLADELDVRPEDIHGYRAGLEVHIRRDVIRAAQRIRPGPGAERRRRAIVAVQRGATIHDVAEAAGVSIRTIHRWVRAA